MFLFLRFGFRNLYRRKSRTIISIIGVILAVFLFVSVNSAVNSIADSIIESYTYSLGDFDIIVYRNGFSFFNTTNTTEIVNSVENVNVTVPRLIFRGIAYTKEDTRIGLLLVGINNSLDDQIGSFESLVGETRPEDNNTILLPKIANLLGYKVGDSFILTTYNFEEKKWINVSLTVSGIVNQRGKLPRDIQNVIFIEIGALQKILGLNDSANMLFVKLNKDIIDTSDIDMTVTRIVKIGSEIQKALGFDYNIVLIKAQTLSQISGIISSQRVLLNIFILVALMMSFVLVISAMFMNVSERIHEIGLLRSIGFSKLQVLITFLTEAFILGISGTFLGIIISYLIGPYLIVPILIQRAQVALIAPTVSEETILYGLILGIGVSVFAGVVPALSASRITPIEALSPAIRRISRIGKVLSGLNPERVNRSLLLGGLIVFLSSSTIIVYFPILNFYSTQAMRIAFNFINLGIILIGITLAATAALPVFVKVVSYITFNLMAIERKLSVRNILRNRRRSDLTFFMLTTSIAFILLVGTLTNTYSLTAQISIQNNLGGDIVVFARSSVPENLAMNISEIEGVKSVTTVTTALTVKAGDLILWKQYTLNIYGVNTTTFVEATYTKDDYFEGITAKEALNKLNNDNRSIIISKGLADALKLSVGEQIRIETVYGTLIFNITAVATFLPAFSFTKFEQKAAVTDALVSLTTYKNITNNQMTISRFIIKTEENANVEEVSQDILSEFGEEYDIQVVTTEELVESVRENYEQTLTMFSTLLIFAVIISILGHVTSLLTSVTERTWEIGIIRSMGMSQKQVLRIFIFEALLLGITGFFVGFLSSFVVSFELIEATNLMSEIPTPLAIPYELFLELFVLVTIVSIVASGIMTSLKLKKNVVVLLRTGSRI